jgi:hypothetical protein
MRVRYEPEDVKFWTEVLLQAANANNNLVGGSLPGFSGLRYQRGAGLGSFFSGLFRLALPIIKSAGRAIGKQALESGASIMQDLSSGKEPSRVFKARGREAFGSLLTKAGNSLQQQQAGAGLGLFHRVLPRKRKLTSRQPKIHKRRKGAGVKRKIKRNIFDTI